MGNKITIKVLVSCPSDVQEEVKFIDDICKKLSTIPKIQTNTEVVVYSFWLGNLTTPRITGEKPQKLINSDIEKINPDIFIGIMWNKFGDIKENNLSPTEEEFNIALDKYKKNGKPLIQFYFKNKSISLNTTYECEQRKLVIYFKERLSRLGLYSSFKEFNFPYEFTTESFQNQITNCIKFFFENFDTLTYNKIPKIMKYEFNDLKSYIPRRVYDIKDENQFYLIEPEKYSEELISLIQKETKIVLLGDAGTGKTLELKRVAQYFSDDDKPLYPIYKSLNLYVDEILENYLPAEWREYTVDSRIDENHLLIILDGFDEIEAKCKLTAQRRILQFCEEHPKVHILISCRSNFYNKETKEESGTLNNFNSYSLLGLTENQIKEYITDNIKPKKSEEFRNNILSKKLYYLLEIPFYLINLVSYYTENGRLPFNKAEVFTFLIDKRIKLDEQKYSTAIELNTEKTRVFRTLEKLALGMELLCKNQISDGEYHKIIPDTDLRNLIKHSTCWKNLKFEHNNFQEFLAANALSKLEFSEIREIITFSPEHKQIIPSWTNTLSYLFSILDKDNKLLIELQNWIIGTQPNILLCAEPDKIEKSIRFEIFKNIFNSYKEKGLWINIQKFTNRDFVKFGESEDTIDFLLNEISPANPLISRKEAVYLIGYFSNPYNKKSIIKEKLQSIIFSKYESNYIKYLSILTLSSLNITNEEEIEKIVQKFKNSEDDNIRYAIYRLINKNELTDKYIEVFLEGIKFTRKSFYREDKPINTGEILQLGEGLASSKRYKSLEKIIKYFKDNPDEIDNAYIEKSFDIIIFNTIEIYKSTNSNSIFNIILDLTTSFKERYYYDGFYKKIITFFEKTDTLYNAFIKVYKMTIDLRKKMILLSNLSNNETLEFIIKEYENKNITNDFIISYQNYLRSNNYKYYESFNNLLVKKFGDKFKLQPQTDYKKQREERIKKDIRLLFDKKAFIDEIKLIFEKIGKFNPNEKDLFKFDTDNWENRYYSKIIYDTLLSFANKKTISVESVIKTFNDSNYWDMFKIGNINKLMNKKEYIPRNEQKKWIENWCISNVKKVNFKTENKKTDKGYSRSLLSVFLVYFMKEMDFSYKESVMLDILSFVTSLESIDFIEKILSGLLKDIACNVIFFNSLVYLCKFRLIEYYRA